MYLRLQNEKSIEKSCDGTCNIVKVNESLKIHQYVSIDKKCDRDVPSLLKGVKRPFF